MAKRRRRERQMHYIVAALIVVVGAWLWSRAYGQGPSLKDSVTLIPTVAGIVELFWGSRGTRSHRGDDRSLRLEPSFKNGLYGGLIGGTAGGLMVALAYYIDNAGEYREAYRNAEVPGIAALIVPFGAFSGLVLGATTQLGMVVATGAGRTSLSRFLGGLLGGLIGGAVVGLVGGWLFGFRDIASVNVSLVVWAAVPCATFIALGVVLYNYEGPLRYVLGSLSISVVIAIFVATIGVLIAGQQHVASWLDFEGNATTKIYQASLILGSLTGSVIGFVVVTTMLLFRYADTQALRQSKALRKSR